MACTTRFLTFEWPHHAWRRRVTSTEYVSTMNGDMWGRTVPNAHVRCHTEYVCDACGATRDAGSCLCDTAKGDHCAIRLACLAGRPAQTT